MREEYQKNYRSEYALKKKIVTFPLDIAFFQELSRRSKIIDCSVNSFAKNIVTTYLNNEKPMILTSYQTEQINQYIKISRSIANNFNQMAHNSNNGLGVDINILLKTLKSYEDNFTNIIQGLNNDN